MKVQLSLLVAVAVMLAAGTIFSPSFYRKATEAGFNYTLVQSDVVVSLGLAGFSLGFPAGFIVSRLSSMWVCVISCAVSTIANLLLWSSTKAPQFYVDKNWLLGIYNFLAGHGLSYLYQVALWVNLRNASRQKLGHVIGALHAVLSLSPELLALITLTSCRPSIAAIVLLALTTLATFLGILGLRLRHNLPLEPTPSADVRTLTTDAFEYAPSDAGSTIDDSDDEELVPSVASAALPSVDGFWGTCRSAWFQTLLWAFGLGSGASFALIWNLPWMLSSASCESAGVVCGALFAVFSSLSSFGSGVLSDRLLPRLPRSNFLFVSSFCFLISLPFCFIYLHDCGSWIVLAISAGISYGALWCLVPTLIAHRCSHKLFTFFWSCALLMSVVCSSVVQIGLSSAVENLTDMVLLLRLSVGTYFILNLGSIFSIVAHMRCDKEQ